MNVVILQPSYIPWRGYFHQIQKADVFVFYDCVQYDDRGWRNRNKIKTPAGAKWLTIPVRSKGCQVLATPIHEIPIVWDAPWNESHLRMLQANYAKAPCYPAYRALLEEIYATRHEKLADFTCQTTERLARALGIQHTRFVRSSSLGAEGQKTDRLLSLLTKLGATHYISGPSAKDYMEEDKFRACGISIEYMQYDYPDYPQLHGAFEPQVSILDLLLNVGEAAASYIWGASRGAA